MIVLTNDESAGDIRSSNALRVVGSRGARSTTLFLLHLLPKKSIHNAASHVINCEQPQEDMLDSVDDGAEPDA